MKPFCIRITQKAEEDVAHVLAWFRDQQAEAAGTKWYAQLQAVFEKLEEMPDRCGLVAEASDLGRDVREILLGKRRGTCRVLFEISGENVDILRVWHSARDAASREDLWG